MICTRPARPPCAQVEGSTRAFPKTKEQYVNWGDEDFMDGSRGSRWGPRRRLAGAGVPPGSKCKRSVAVGWSRGLSTGLPQA